MKPPMHADARRSALIGVHLRASAVLFLQPYFYVSIKTNRGTERAELS
jgi:hypothetical protein